MSHLAAALGALAGAWFMHRKGRGHPLRNVSLLIFSGSLLFLFAMSGVYHGLPPGPARAFFRRLDYMGIWIVIAGSATPVHNILLRGHWRWGMTAAFWAAALTCLVIVDVYFEQIPYWGIITSYMGVASLGAVSFSRIMARYGWKETVLLFLGCVCYGAGAAIDYLERPALVAGWLGPHELFHLLVVAGAAMHWAFVYDRAARDED